MAETEDLYAQLGVPPTATPAEIAQAYAGLVAACAADPQRLLEMSSRFQTLLDPARRAEYDRSRGAAAAPAPPAASPPPTTLPGSPPTAAPSPGAGIVPTGAAVRLSPPGPPPFDTADLQNPVPGAPQGFTPSAGAGPEVTTRVTPPDLAVPGSPGGFSAMGAGPVGAGSVDATVLVSAAPPPGPVGEVTQRPQSLNCPVCGTANMVGMIPGGEYCQDCGFLLSQAPGEGQTASTDAVSLVSTNGDREFPLREGINTVGRTDADVLVPDNTVSRLHARLHLSGTTLEVEDTNSTNGTKLNRNRIEPGRRVPVSDGDELQFGQVALRVQGAAGSGGGPTGTIIETGPRLDTPLTGAGAQTGPEIARFVALTGDSVYPVYQFPTTVGRRPDSDIVINDPYVSGRHAEIRQEDSGYVLQDLGSTNGTALGADLLTAGTPVSLQPGATVAFGKQRFRFEVAEAGTPGEGTAEAGLQDSERTAMMGEAPPTEPAASAEPSTASEPASTMEPAANQMGAGGVSSQEGSLTEEPDGR